MKTKKGRDRLVVRSTQERVRVKRRDRRVFAVEALTEEQIEAIKIARIPDDTSISMPS
jgi:hypothetical protein